MNISGKSKKPARGCGIEMRGESLRGVVGDIPRSLLRWSWAALALAAATWRALETVPLSYAFLRGAYFFA